MLDPPERITENLAVDPAVFHSQRAPAVRVRLRRKYNLLFHWFLDMDPLGAGAAQRLADGAFRMLSIVVAKP